MDGSRKPRTAGFFIFFTLWREPERVFLPILWKLCPT